MADAALQTEDRTIKLQVAAARQEESGHGIARLSRGSLSAIGAMEGDVLTTAMILMRWRQLAGAGTSTLEATRRLTAFIAEHCAHRPYAADWARYGEEMLSTAFAREADKLATLAPQFGN